jgi:hypothetical protein
VLRRSPLLLLVLATACSSGSSPAAPAASKPAPTSAAPSPVSPPVPPRTVAVVRPAGPVELYALLGAAATRSARLQPPKPTATALQVTGSAGPDRVVCVLWQLRETEYPAAPDRRLVCYPAAGAPVTVSAAGSDAKTIAVRPDGRALAWSDSHPEGNETITTATYTAGRTTDLHKYLARPAQPAGSSAKSFTGSSADDLAWNGPAELVITVGIQSDDGSGPVRFPLGDPKKGWLDGAKVSTSREDAARGYFTYDRIVAVDDSTALAVERPQGLGDGPQPPERAVRIALSTGRVLDVVATAAAGRYLSNVSGDRAVALYRTAANEEGSPDPKVYVRTAADPRGTPVTGLPPDVTSAVLLP